MSPASRSPLIHGLRGWRPHALRPLGLLIQLWGRSLHFRVSPAARAHMQQTNRPMVVALWHNRLFVAAEIFRRYRSSHPLHALISPSRDGAWLEAFFSLVGLRAVRGSSHKLGRQAVNLLVNTLRSGHDIGITPDGPRGPLYEFKAGGLIVARRAHAPILLLGCTYDRSWQLPTWDRFHLPLPFSTVRIHCELVDDLSQGDRTAGARALQARLLDLNPDPRTTEVVV